MSSGSASSTAGTRTSTRSCPRWVPAPSAAEGSRASAAAAPPSTPDSGAAARVSAAAAPPSTPDSGAAARVSAAAAPPSKPDSGAAARSATLHGVPSLFRRKSPDLVTEQVDEVTEPEPVAPARPKGYTPKKGEATPRRPVANRRVAEPKPANAKEARALARRKRQEDAAARRKGMAEGDDRYVMARDKGPVRRFVRDIVDARRNVGSLFIVVTVLILALSTPPIPAARIASNAVFLAFILSVVLDSVLLSRRIKRLVGAKFPKRTERRGSLYQYAIMRALSPRFMRMPKPRVKPGDPVS